MKETGQINYGVFMQPFKYFANMKYVYRMFLSAKRKNKTVCSD